MEINGDSDKSANVQGNSFSSTEKCDSAANPRSDTAMKRQINKNDSGICDDKCDSSCDESFKRKKVNDGEGDVTGGTVPQTSDWSRAKSPNNKGDGFHKIKSRFKNRNYRNRSQADCEGDRESSDDETTDSQKTKVDIRVIECSTSSVLPGASSSNKVGDESEAAAGGGGPSRTWDEEYCLGNNDPLKRPDDQISITSTNSSTSSIDSSTSSIEYSKYDTIDSEKEDPPSVLLKPKPKHKWFVTPEIINRQIGFSNARQSSELFRQRMYGSLHSVQRLELMYKLKYHFGCVNSLNFNQSGSLLASGSDDLQICIWDWPVGKLLTSFDTGHKSNVFQAKFLPLSGDTHMVTCARDGQIRLVELAGNGELRATRKLYQHRGPAHKLATQCETPHTFLSCGEDALVMSLDVRQSKPSKVLYVKEGAKKVSLYSIHSNPLNNHEFVVSGRDNYLRIYDQRNASTPKSKFCPQHLHVKEPCPHITCAVFNYNGTEVVASYNDEDIYLFDTRHSDGCDYVHRYQGHRNSATVKGVNFFGPKSEFVVSGSDCGNIFFWERESEAIVQWMAGDENGVVNCLEPHPDIPILATSGLDEDVKIWVPSCEQEPTLTGLKKTVIANLKNRHSDPARNSDTFQMLWILWRHIRHTDRHAREERERTRSAPESGDSHDGGSSSGSSGNSDGS